MALRKSPNAASKLAQEGIMIRILHIVIESNMQYAIVKDSYIKFKAFLRNRCEFGKFKFQIYNYLVIP